MPVDGNQYAGGSTITVMGPGNLTRDGYTFAGGHDGTTLHQPLDTFPMPEGDVMLTAQWTGETATYTVTFVDHDGTVLKIEEVEEGPAATAPEALSRTGHTFTGWDVAFDIITADLTVTAQYQNNQYRITFDSSGGSAVAPITQAFGTAITAPADPVKEGYGFVGWEPELPETMPAGGLTVVAQWEEDALSFSTWIASYGGLSAEDSEPLADPAGAGVPNLLKYAFGLSPLERAENPGPWLETVQTDGERYLSLRLRVRPGGVWADGIYTVNGIHYRVEYSPDLIEWFFWGRSDNGGRACR